MTAPSIVGASPIRHDALAKVSGAARYPGDLAMPGMLQMAVLFARRPHARIVRLDPSRALARPGVVAVLTAADVPRNEFGLIENDQPVLCGDVVRFYGDKVALVIAESERAARAACGLIDVEYEDLPVVSDPVAAMRPDSPLVHPPRGTNVLEHLRIRKGDADAAFAREDLVIVEGEFATPWQEHAFLQPEAGLAYVDEAGKVVVETAGQWSHEDRRQIAHALGLAEEQVRVVYAAIGGAFGGREDISIQITLGLAAWKLRRPVKLTWTREESLIGHIKRHPMRFRTRWGATREGKIVAVACECVADGGAYASTSAEVLKNAALYAAGCYEVEHITADAYAVYTNNVPSGAFRGFGAPQSQFAAELMLARLAEALGMDAVELRARNIYREGSIQATQAPLPPGVSAPEVLERCALEAGWRKTEAGWRRADDRPTTNDQRPTRADDKETRRQGDKETTNPELNTQHSTLKTAPPSSDSGDHIRRGKGFACGIKNIGYSFGYPEQANAQVELHGGGEVERVLVRCGAADVGQGSHLALRQIAAETVGVPLERVEIVADDTDQAPSAGSASASRMTLMAGGAVRGAAQAALEAWVEEEERPAIARYQFRPPRTTPLDPETGACVPNFSYGYVAQAVEVEVDTATGHVYVLRVISAHDIGKAINRQQVEGQVEGCVAQALGYALIEHFQMRDGAVLTPHFSSYLLPTALDTPLEVRSILLEHADPVGPFGARGMAEMPLVPFAAAVADAVHDATGVWLNEIPLTPDRVWAGLKAAEGR
jgi:CO/xanthine dehydrogenase Mo-binding subunit